MVLESGPGEGPDNEEIEVHGRADHCDPAGAGGGREDRRGLSQHGISGATFYAWKAKFGGMEPSEAKRLKALEDENAKLKRLLAEAMLNNTALKVE